MMPVGNISMFLVDPLTDGVAESHLPHADGRKMRVRRDRLLACGDVLHA